MAFIEQVEDSEQNQLHPLITEGREGGTSYYISMRKYPSGDAEVTAIKLGPDDSLKRGGGAKRKNDDKELMDDPTLQKSQHRAKRTVRQKCLSAQVDRMLTCTFRENVTDILEAWLVFKYFCKLMRWRYGERFQYIAVPEKQKRGAIHFHLAIKGYFDVKIVRNLWRRAAGKREGNIDITPPKKFGKKSWNPKRIAQYLAKYITKSETVEFNKKRFSTGGKIQVPEPIRGWLMPSLNFTTWVDKVLDEVIQIQTRRLPSESFNVEGYFNIIYKST